jgi:hypothetical protein
VPELQFDSVMREPLPHHSRADARFVQQIHRALLEDSCTHALFDSPSAPHLQHNRFDSLQMQKVGEQQSRRSGPDNSDLSSHEEPPSASHWLDEMIHICR